MSIVDCRSYSCGQILPAVEEGVVALYVEIAKNGELCAASQPQNTYTFNAHVSTSDGGLSIYKWAHKKYGILPVLCDERFDMSRLSAFPALGSAVSFA